MKYWQLKRAGAGYDIGSGIRKVREGLEQASWLGGDPLKKVSIYN
jgi:hypothetical protein